MANPNNQEPLSMEDRVCKLEAQVGELGIKIDTQFHATVEKLRVKVSNLRDEMFNFRNEILEALGLDNSAPPEMNPVQRGSRIQTPSMAPQLYQLSPPLVQLEDGRSDRSAPLVLAEESGYLVGGSEAVKIAGDSELLMTNQEVKVCEGVVPCLVDNGMLKDSRTSLDNLEEHSAINEEIAVEVTDKNENLLVPVNRVGIDDEHDTDNDDGFSNSVEQMEKSVRKLVGKTPNDYVNPDEVFALEAVIQDGVLVGNESDIVLLNVTLLSIALKTRGGSNVGGAGINIDFAFLIRIGLTNMRLVVRVVVEPFCLSVNTGSFYANPKLLRCSGFPFDPGEIMSNFSLSARNNSSVQCAFECGFLKSRWLKPEECLLIANEGLSILRLLLDQFMDTLVGILLVAVVILLMLVWYDKDEGGEMWSLIGEDETVSKTAKVVPEEVDIQEKNCMVLASTIVVNEHCICLVTQTGMGVEKRKVHSQTQEASQSEEDTPLKKKLNEFEESLNAIMGVICALVWLINVKYFIFWEFVVAWPRNFKFSFEKCTYQFEISVDLVKVEMLGCTAVATNQISMAKLVTMSSKANILHSFNVEEATYDPFEGKPQDWSLVMMEQYFLHDGLVAVISLVFAWYDGDKGGERGITAFMKPLVIFLILIFNFIVRVWQENNAGKALEALKEIQSKHATMIRKGNKAFSLPDKDVVLGNFVELRVRDKVQADMRILSLIGLIFWLEQGPLTRESSLDLTAALKAIGKLFVQEFCVNSTQTEAVHFESDVLRKFVEIEPIIMSLTIFMIDPWDKDLLEGKVL
nr:calcium-transporting ATPase 4, endoplasmic reticulum-type-like [Ipomoea batatas]GMD75037.1 calcium-transporting ATPase 4, endoplasmic reticulum-type-like [Ipomoea batatas]